MEQPTVRRTNLIPSSPSSANASSSSSRRKWSHNRKHSSNAILSLSTTGEGQSGALSPRAGSDIEGIVQGATERSRLHGRVQGGEEAVKIKPRLSSLPKGGRSLPSPPLSPCYLGDRPRGQSCSPRRISPRIPTTDNRESSEDVMETRPNRSFTAAGPPLLHVPSTPTPSPPRTPPTVKKHRRRHSTGQLGKLIGTKYFDSKTK